MAISKKGRRLITVDGERYLWWVKTEDDHPVLAGHPVVTAASEDGALLVQYHLEQTDQTRYLTVIGRRFRDGYQYIGRHRRFRCPRFEEDRSVTPSLVAHLLRWCGDTDDVLVEVDYRGAELEP